MAPETSAGSDVSDNHTSVSGSVSGDEVLINVPRISSTEPPSATSSKSQPQSKEVSGKDRLAGMAGDSGKVNLNLSSPGIKYLKSYVGNSGKEIEKQEVPSVEELGYSSYGDAIAVSPMELIWPIRLNVDTWAEFETNKGNAVPPVVSSGPYVLRINSPAIITAIQETIDYWPGLDASLGSLEIEEPFRMLYHYRTELEEYNNRKLAELALKLPEQLCEREEGLQHHMATLFQFLDNRSEAHQIKQERQRHQAEEPTITYSMIWLLYKPGTIVFRKSADGDSNAPQAYVIHSVSGGVTGSRSEDLLIRMWYIDSDGVGMGRQLFQQLIVPTDDELPISTLTVVPWEMYRIEHPGEVSEEARGRRNQLVEWGKLFVEAFGRKCVDFDGDTFTTPKTKVVSRVIIDHDTYFSEQRAKLKAGAEHENLLETIEYQLNDSMKLMPSCTCLICSSLITKAISQPKSPYTWYDLIRSKTSVYIRFKGKELETFYMLCNPRIFAYVPGLRTWKSLHISGAKESQWNTSMIDDRLVMDPAKLKTIKALAYRYTQWNSGGLRETDIDDGKSKEKGLLADRPWAADFVEKKGDSVIFLLHGKPGVGKTYTAECVAEFVRRPLLSLTSNDVGTNSEVVETRLSGFFRRAELWGAVILLDEADIFLEQRTLHDLDRNSLVSAFLRSLEYFQGILFLTTNRVGTFDDAFLSRIHVVLHYEFEEAERRQVWRMFFDKLQREREQSIRIHESARSYVEENEDLKSLAWNGRDIRNAFQTAVALAESEAISRGKKDGKVELTRNQLEQIVAMSKNFMNYLQKVHGQETEKAAATRKDRYEYTKQQRR